jgi:non-ribosomal peptide synthetase component F
MSDFVRHLTNLPPEQQVIRATCFHSTGTVVEFPIEDVETSISARFEKIVRIYPNNLAVKTDGDAVTYAELNAMANRVAHAIIAERGDRPEPIGALLGKGVEQIAALLGILKAGKFFTLLDPSVPTDRLSLVLEDSQASLLLVDQQTLSLVQQDTPVHCKLMRIDTLAHSIPDEDPKIPISSHALAYIVYTSGSTGRPKGVMRQHRALLHDAMLRVHTDGISKNDRLAHITAGTANSVTNSCYALLQDVVILDALPLTAGGKVDLHALPVPIRTRPELEDAFVPPSTPIEKALATVWTEVLGIDQTNIHDNFLDLGGKSLLTTRIVPRVIDRFQAQLPVQALFETSTVAEMAAIVIERQAKKLGEKEVETILTELESLSEQEAERFLDDVTRDKQA